MSITVETSATLLSTSIITNYGTLANNGTLTGVSNGGFIDNKAGATVSNAGTISYMSITTNGTFTNTGTYNMNQTNGALTLNTTSNFPSGINWTTGSILIGASSVVTLSNNFSVPSSCYLQVNTGGSLIINSGVTLSNNHSVIINSTVTNNGTIENRLIFTVNAGATLTNNYAFNNSSAFTNNGTLKGSGTYSTTSGINFGANSVVSPGASPGLMRFTGNSLNMGIVQYYCEINGNNRGVTYDAIDATQNVIITNASLAINWGTYIPPVGTTFTILNVDATRTITGPFASVTIPPIAGLNFTVTYNTTSVVLTVAAAAPATITSAQSGLWYETTTWIGGNVPTTDNDVIIDATHTVQVVNSAANCKNLTLNANSRLDQRNTLIIGGDLTINGTFNHAYDIFSSSSSASTQIGASSTSDAAGQRVATVNGTLSFGNNLIFGGFFLGGRMVFGAGSTLDLKTNCKVVLTGWSGATPQYLMDIDNLTTLNMDSYSSTGIIVPNGNGSQPILSPNRDFQATCNYTNSSYDAFNLSANNTYYFEGTTLQTIQSIILGTNATLNMNKTKLRKLEAVSGGNIYSTDGQFSNISAGGGTTLYGDYTLVDNCNTFVPPLFSNTGNLSFDNNMTLKVNVTDYAIMNIPIGASQNVLGTLNIQNGKLIVKGGTLDLRNATVTGLSNTRYFETQVGTSPYNTLGSVLLPAVGTAPVNFNLGITLSNGTSVYAPVNIVSNNGNNNISINLQTLSVPTGYVAPAIKWNITPSAGSSNLTITFTWPASAESILFANNRNSAKVYHYNSNTDTWEELPTSAVTTNSDGSFSVTASNITTFSPFAVMVNNTVLKAELINFTAKANNDQAVLTWQTATETNVKNFDIEKSADGQKFERITEVKAKNTPSLYQAFDNDFSASAYYRLKINDLDGKTDYSKVVFLEKSPFGGKGAKIRSNTEGSVWIETDTQIESIHVVNTIGQVVKTTKDKQFSIADLPKGIYVVVVKTNRGFVSEKVLSPMK